MLTLKCTQKALDFLRVSKAELVSPSHQELSLGAWFVNQFMVGRSKVFIFMNERTLLSFVLFGATKANSPKHKFPEMFLTGLTQLLRFEGISDAHIAQLVTDYSSAEYAPTDSRSALGNMNELVFLYQHHIEFDGGLNSCNLGEIMKRINRTPQRNIGWNRSIELTRELLGLRAN